MNIIWNENPLFTQIMLDEHEKKEFWYKIKIEELQEMITEGYFYLDEQSSYYSVKQARDDLDPERFIPTWHDSSKKGQKSKIDQRVDELFNAYITDLERDPHCGDCTCFPSSCSKCHAENILGIDTIKGIHKHEARAIDSAFTKPGTKFPERDNQNTISEAIAHLEQYIPTASWNGAEAHFERWIEENIRATNWLKQYRDEHFPS